MIHTELQLILEEITSCQRLHGRWLNTLSFLEYIGTRKILKSLPANILDKTLLSHIAEEAFHSLFFKKLARKVIQKDYSFRKEELLFPEECEDYFQQLDKKAESLSNGNKILNYLYTTWIVETRAVTVYSLYNRILQTKLFPFTLNSILKDEEKHLTQVKSLIEKIDGRHEAHFQELTTFEEKRFTSLLKVLKESIISVNEWRHSEDASASAEMGI